MADGVSVSGQITVEFLEYVRKNRKKLDLLDFGDKFGRQVITVFTTNSRQSSTRFCSLLWT